MEHDSSMRILIILSHVDCPLSLEEIYRRKNLRLEPRNGDRKPQTYLDRETLEKEILPKEMKNKHIETSKRPTRRPEDLKVYKLTDDGRQYLKDQGYCLL